MQIYCEKYDRKTTWIEGIATDQNGIEYQVYKCHCYTPKEEATEQWPEGETICMEDKALHDWNPEAREIGIKIGKALADLVATVYCCGTNNNSGQ